MQKLNFYSWSTTWDRSGSRGFKFGYANWLSNLDKIHCVWTLKTEPSSKMMEQDSNHIGTFLLSFKPKHHCNSSQDNLLFSHRTYKHYDNNYIASYPLIF